MRRLNRWQSLVQLVGGVLMVAGAVGYALLLFQDVSSVIYMVGAVCFVVMQSLQRYDGNLLTVRRLRRIMGFAEVCFLFAGLLMLEQQYGFVRSRLSGAAYDNMVVYTYNKWVVLLLIAALLEMYTMIRISNELRGEE